MSVRPGRSRPGYEHGGPGLRLRYRMGQVLDGTAALRVGDDDPPLSELDAFLLPPGSDVSLVSEGGAELITLTVPDAMAFDPSLASIGPDPQFVDLSLEPLLHYEHDDRMRIYLASKTLFGTTARSGEIVIFPPGSAGKNQSCLPR